jgi:protein O-mannosyl-transferase
VSCHADLTPGRMRSGVPTGPSTGLAVSWGVAVAVAVGLVAVVAFLPVLSNGFVDQWDDQTNFLENPNYRGLGWSQIRWACTTVLQGVYQPLAWILLEAEYLAWGLNPKGYHLASLALHAVDSVLFYVLIRAVVSRVLPEIETGRSWVISLASGLAAALFAAHPLRVEVVAWVSCQPYLPCAGFTLMSVLAYLRTCPENRRRLVWLSVSIALYAAALGSKAVPVGLPLVVVILDVAVLKRSGAGRSAFALVAEKMPFVVLAVIAAMIAVKAKADPPRRTDHRPGPARLISERVAVSGYGLVYYLQKTAWPRALSAYHFRPEPIDVVELRFVASLGVAAALGVAAYRQRRRRPSIAAALLAYALLLAPNLGLVSYGSMLVADRYAYIATMPLYVLAAGGLARGIAAGRRPKIAALGVCATGFGLAGILMALSWAQCRTWRDSNVLRLHALQVGTGRDAVLRGDLGLDLLTAGRVEEGFAHLRMAVRIDPTDPDVRGSLGVALKRKGNLSAAIAQFAEAVRLAPHRFEPRYQLGMALLRHGRIDEAGQQLLEAVRRRPYDADAHVGLGGVLAAQGRNDEAAAEFAEALRVAPGHAGARQSLDELLHHGRSRK